ncbi:MAG TPA: DUF2934 domain-containing protein [Terriglobales bacterium]|jgi:hypothetical protein
MPKAKTPRVTNGTRSKKVIQMPEVVTTPAVTDAGNGTSRLNGNLESQIRMRAYELYQERGCTPGGEIDDWANAEREILARHTQQQSA